MHARIIVDGITLLDTQLSQWQQLGPEQLTNIMPQPGTRPEPWRIATQIALSQAILTDKPVDILVQTHPGDGWTLTVSHLGQTT